MNYTYDEVIEFVEQEEVRFIRLAFCDPMGRQKNVAITPNELRRAFEDGISLDASAIPGFADEAHSDLFLFPIPSTLTPLPWRSAQGKVVRMFCELRWPDGTPFDLDSRAVLNRAVAAAKEKNLSVDFGSELEFYLFQRDEKGQSTKIPLDQAGYMDTAPEDRGENVRREICLTLMEMGIIPESSHHEEGPGQNEIDFRYSDAVTAADHAVNFISVVKAVAVQNGLCADFSPKPLPEASGNGLHINMSLRSTDGLDLTDDFLAGILAHMREITVFLNPCRPYSQRQRRKNAPKYISWSRENRSPLIRIPAAKGKFKRLELRSPDPMANPYLAFALLIYAGLDGIQNKLPLQDATDLNLFTASPEEVAGLSTLPASLEEAAACARSSKFVASVLPEGFLTALDA